MRQFKSVLVVRTAAVVYEITHDICSDYFAALGLTIQIMYDMRHPNGNSNPGHDVEVSVSFNHFNSQGQAHMVDVSAKEASLREAVVEARVTVGSDLLARILDRDLTKGDVLGVARLAGIAATKKTPDLIPLAHPLALHHVAVDFETDVPGGVLKIRCTVRAHEKTGVEMEAMTGATVAGLTVYDMCKGVARDIELGPVRLLRKSGGRSGVYEYQASETEA